MSRNRPFVGIRIRGHSLCSFQGSVAPKLRADQAPPTDAVGSLFSKLSFRDARSTGKRMIRNMIVVCALACMIRTVPFTGAVASEQQSFDRMGGSWSGSGFMKSSDGPRERVKCKAEYIAKNEGHSLNLQLQCASDAYKMKLSANIEQEGSALSGNWFESQYRQGGKISGRNANDLIEARIESDTIVALLTVRTNGERQSFTMDAPGAWVSQVSKNLLRDHR